ncbi:MAG TPA: pyridoxal-phosphate dependent enzyme [Longimicrobiales bacterium]
MTTTRLDVGQADAARSPAGRTSAPVPALFRRFPELATRIPWLPIGSFPTPVESFSIEGIRAPGVQLHVKRDDLCARPYGGNKVRKLEFILAEAKRRGVERLITVGAVGSHHALATTVYGRALGFDVTLVLFPQQVTDHVRRVLLLDCALGAELRFTPRMESVPAALVAARLAHWRQRTCVIAAGGSDPIGTLGYVSGALELAEQIADRIAPRPDAVHVAAGTLGTAAGLAIGFALAGLDIPINATRITSRLVTNERALARLVSRTLEHLRRAGLASAPPPAAALRLVRLRHDFVGPGYGRETEGGRDAAARFRRAGLTLDATYTAKAAAELISTVGEGGQGTHLFWHTLSAHEPEQALGGVRPADLPEPFRRLLGV